MKRIALFAAVLLVMSMLVGCATKGHVRKETTPIINKVNELDDLTARTTNDIRDVDSRSQQGIQSATAKATEADQKAQTAQQTATQANELATTASTRVGALTDQVLNLDNYRPLVETSVHFAFGSAVLSKKAKAALDELGAEIANAKSFIITVDGHTDSVGGADANYRLSQRRADSVIQYLVSNFNVPGHKIHVIGLGKDDPKESNRTASGRAKNRRVDVRLMTNIVNAQAATATPATTPQQPQQ